MQTQPNINLDKIYNRTIEKQIEVFKIFEQNLEQRNERMKNVNTHVILDGSTVDPI